MWLATTCISWHLKLIIYAVTFLSCFFYQNVSIFTGNCISLVMFNKSIGLVICQRVLYESFSRIITVLIEDKITSVSICRSSKDYSLQWCHKRIPNIFTPEMFNYFCNGCHNIIKCVIKMRLIESYLLCWVISPTIFVWLSLLS